MGAAGGGPTARPWVASYPEGVPHDIDAADTLAELIRETARTQGDAPAYECLGSRLTFAQTLARAEAFGAFLQARGFAPGNRLALMLPNLLAYPIAMWGALLAGVVVVNVNPLYTARELEQQLRDAGARGLVVLENFGHVAAEALGRVPVELTVVAGAGDGMGLKGHLVDLGARHVKRSVPPYALPGHLRLRAALREGGKRGLAQPPIGPDTVAFLQYTGGTTGIAKGAVLTHANVSANVAQVTSWFGGTLPSNGPDGTGGTVMITALPLYHVFALTCCALYMARIGGLCVLIPNPRDVGGLIDTMARTRFTCMSGVNTLYNAIAHHPEAHRIDFRAMVLAVAGGMATQGQVARAWKALSGRPIVEGYGLSETSPVVSINRPDIIEFTGTIGYPLPSTEVVIRDPAGNDLTPGEAGELCVRGPQVMQGYWNRPEETAAAMTGDGYFRTGDVAVMGEDGSLRIVDRLKDMVLVSGFNVYPSEVEEVLASHPGVAEVAVVGMPDVRTGEAVVAHVVLRDPDLTEAALQAHAREALASYKVPRRVVMHETLPKTTVGKILRRALRV